MTATATETFWNSRYLTGDTGWDMHQLSPPLQFFIDNIPQKDAAILIPGCGNAYEAAYLADEGFTNVTLIDISSHLVDSLKKKNGGKPVMIIHGDFFEHRGHYDWILEQTFFCAIDPSQRNNYVSHAFELLRPGGRLAGVMFNDNFGFADHPPYSGSADEYRKLFDPYFNVVRMEPCDISIPPRAGNELLVEFEKKSSLK